MADITMCQDHGCPRKNQCYRMLAPVTEYRQAYFMNSPRDYETNECDYFDQADEYTIERSLRANNRTGSPEKNS